MICKLTQSNIGKTLLNPVYFIYATWGTPLCGFSGYKPQNLPFAGFTTLPESHLLLMRMASVDGNTLELNYGTYRMCARTKENNRSLVPGLQFNVSVRA